MHNPAILDKQEPSLQGDWCMGLMAYQMCFNANDAYNDVAKMSTFQVLWVMYYLNSMYGINSLDSLISHWVQMSRAGKNK